MKVTLDNIRLPEKGKPQAFHGKSHFQKLFKENLDFHSVILNKILDLQVGEVTRFLSENPFPFKNPSSESSNFQEGSGSYITNHKALATVPFQLDKIWSNARDLQNPAQQLC